METVKTGFIEITSHDSEFSGLFCSLRTLARQFRYYQTWRKRTFFSTKECLFTGIAIEEYNLIEGESGQLYEKNRRRVISQERRHLPGRGAVPVKNVEVLAAEQLAPIDAGLDGSEAA